MWRCLNSLSNIVAASDIYREVNLLVDYAFVKYASYRDEKDEYETFEEINVLRQQRFIHEAHFELCICLYEDVAFVVK